MEQDPFWLACHRSAKQVIRRVLWNANVRHRVDYFVINFNIILT